MQQNLLKILLFVTQGAHSSSVHGITKVLILILFVLCTWSVSYSQEVTVKATTNPKEVQTILEKEREKSRVNNAFFSEHDKCRGLLKSREWTKAESSCRSAISLVEKLPRDRILERSSVRESLAVALLWQRKPEEAISLLNESIEISKSILSDTNSEKGDLYFLLGNAYSLMDDIQTARSYLEKAENTYRSALIDIGDEMFRKQYSRRIRNIVEAHYQMLKLAGLINEAEKLQARLAGVEKEFAQYLNN